VGICIKRLFAYRYQVMPFIYTHLVSLCCFLYLITSAFLLGSRFDPGASTLFGFTFPLLILLAQVISTFGLIEVGETILDPFGDDPEDFALLHFVEVTVCSSHEAIEIESCGKRRRERETFYSHKELHAAKQLVRRMIKRYRWKKMIAMARAEREFRATVRRQNSMQSACCKAPAAAMPKAANGSTTVEAMPACNTGLARDNSTKLPHELDREPGRKQSAAQRRLGTRDGSSPPLQKRNPRRGQPGGAHRGGAALKAEHPGRLRVPTALRPGNEQFLNVEAEPRPGNEQFLNAEAEPRASTSTPILELDA